LRLAAQIARSDDAELTVLRVARPGEELNREAEERACGHLVSECLGHCDARVRTKVAVHEAVVTSILEEAQEGGYDLLVIGASNEWGVKSLLVGAIPDAIADEAPCSVLMVRRYEPSGLSTIRRVMRSLQGW
jgi:nucleotide-binding universal stress UspA family protein